MDILANLETILSGGEDNALLRFSLGNEYLKRGDAARAIEHLRLALQHESGYSAAWKLLGHALAQSGDQEGARDVYEEGIRIAEARGDKQAAREMQVFLRRLTARDR